MTRHILIGVRYNGAHVKLYESNILVQVHAQRERRLKTKKWKMLYIPQGLTCPRPFDVRSGTLMQRMP